MTMILGMSLTAVPNGHSSPKVFVANQVATLILPNLIRRSKT